MAATALKGVFLLALAGIPAAQESKEIRRQVAQVASSLTDSNPAEAIAPFDKSFEGYSRLSDYFSALTNAYRLTNEIEVTDEQITASEAELTVHWVLTMTGLDGGAPETRAEDLTVKLTLKKDRWKIVSLAPLELFDPEPRKTEK